MKRWVGALILIGSAVSLIALRTVLGADNSCENDVSFNLKGTFADCAAREVTQKRDDDEKGVLAKR